MSGTPPYIETRFQAIGEGLDPDQITKLLGLQPTRSGKNGEPSLRSGVRSKSPTVSEPFWQIELVRDSYSTDEGVQEILGLIWERRDAFVNYLKTRPNVRAGFVLTVKLIYDRPVYEISAESLRKLAYLGCDYKIDEVCDLRASNVYDLG